MFYTESLAFAYLVFVHFVIEHIAKHYFSITSSIASIEFLFFLIY